MNKPPRIHIISETAFCIQGQGVHTAFLDCVDLLKSDTDVEVLVNGAGWGDLMHAHTYGPYYFWKGRRYRGRRVFTAHVIPDSIKGSLPLWPVFMPFASWYLRRVYSYADVCIAISPAVKRAIEGLKAKTRIVQIYNPIDTDRFSPSRELRSATRKRLGLPQDAFVVLGVGQLEPRKGVEDFLAISKACTNMHFIWAGGRPFGVMTEGVARLNRQIKSAEGRVRLLGLIPLEDMPAIYNAADLFLFPSYQENCPLAPLEAAASGLPVIYRDISEYVDLYNNPYLKAKDREEFIALTNRMAEDKSFYDQGRLISSRLLTQFNRQTIRKQLLSLYQEMLEG
jgi:1,2-diacylglycerol-3-alpha-glucose alpha-1,2-galactosyltransferase